MKKLLYGFSLIIILIIIIPHFVDWSHYKPPLIAALKKHTGLEVDFKGPLHLKLLPTLCIDANDVTIKNSPHGKATNLLEVENLSMRVTVWSLIQGKLNIEKVALHNPTLYLEVAPDGQPNWVLENNPSSKEKPSTSSQETSSGSEGAFLSLKKAEIKEGKVIYKNLQTGQQEELQHINLQGFFESLKGPFGFDYQVDFRENTFDGTVQVDKATEAEKMPFHLKLSAADAHNKYGTLVVKGSIQGMEVEGDIQSNELNFPFPINLGNQKVDLAKAIKVSGHLVANPRIVQLSHLIIAHNALTVKGEANIQLSPWQAQLTLTEGTSKINVFVKAEKNTASGWEGKTTIYLAKPEFLWQCLGVDPSLSSLQGAFEVSTNFRANTTTYALNDLRFNIGSLQGSGTVTVNQKQPVNQIQADLAVNKLDINALLKSENINGSSKANATARTDERWSKEKWNLSFLKAVDMNCKVKVKELIYDKYAFQDVKGTIQAKNGNLKLTDCQAQGYKGSFKGQATLNQVQATSLSVNLKASGVDPLAIPAVAQTPLKKATLDMGINITAKGDSLYDVVNSLSGDGQIALTQGVIETFDIKGFITMIRHIKNATDISALSTTLNKKAATNFSHLKANFAIKNGHATTPDLELISEEAILTGEGAINLPQWYIDMRMQMKIKDKSKLPPIGIKVEGTLTDPSYKIDQDVLAKVLLQAVSHRVLDKVVGKEGLVGQVVAGALGIEKTENPPQTSASSQEQNSPKDPSLKIGKVLGEIFKG